MPFSRCKDTTFFCDFQILSRFWHYNARKCVLFGVLYLKGEKVVLGVGLGDALDDVLGGMLGVKPSSAFWKSYKHCLSL
jgi:hypothetical protein